LPEAAEGLAALIHILVLTTGSHVCFAAAPAAVLQLVGGVLFLLFGAHALYTGPE
jgi:uncharacterized membrane protein